MIEVYDGDQKRWEPVCDNLDFKVQGTTIEAHDQFYINNRYYPAGEYDWSKTKYPDSIEVSNAPIAHINGIYERSKDASDPNDVPGYRFISSDKNVMPEGYSSALIDLFYGDIAFSDAILPAKFYIWSWLFTDDDSFTIRIHYYTDEDFFTKDSVTWYLWEDGSEVSFTITKKYD